jgi:biotin carboxylase
MRLLVTNARVPQAYTIIRTLRAHAETIVVTMSGSRPLGVWPTCHAAYSRLVDRRYRVPDPEQDWYEGRIQPENTEREQAFIDAVLEICERERIDTIFPTLDAWVYVFSKNKKLFEDHGIQIPVPDYDTVIKPLDKYRTVRCAEEVGFPTPRTYLPENEADVERIARELEPPWVVKWRFTVGGRDLSVVNDVEELRAKVRTLQRRSSPPMIQEYIPGKRVQNFYLVLDRNGQALSTFAPKAIRVSGRVTRSSVAVSESAPPHPLTDQAVRLVGHMGWWGGATVQTKLDARDGQPKLMEVNPRLGANLWYRTELGINEPLLCLKIARGEIAEHHADYPLGFLLLKPIEDFPDLFLQLLDLGIYRTRFLLFGKKSIDTLTQPDTFAEVMNAYRAHYFGKAKRRYSPHFRYALEDPLPALIWASKVLQSRSLMAMRGLGR